jgi:hypothetical protein
MTQERKEQLIFSIAVPGMTVILIAIIALLVMAL